MSYELNFPNLREDIILGQGHHYLLKSDDYERYFEKRIGVNETAISIIQALHDQEPIESTR